MSRSAHYAAPRNGSERLRTAPRNAGGHDVRQLLELFDEALEELLRTEAPSRGGSTRSTGGRHARRPTDRIEEREDGDMTRKT